MDADTAGKLVGLGLSLGVVHVLTGPDHMSALAALSVGSRLKAFSLGLQWGLGHGGGLFVILVLFLSLDGAVSLERVEEACSWVVGVFMVVLGLWNAKAVYEEFSEPPGSREQSLWAAGAADAEGLLGSDDVAQAEKRGSEQERKVEELMHGGILNTFSYEHAVAHFRFLRRWDVKDPFTQRVLAFLAGLIHGAAGPGGVLGVLPAVQLHSWSKSMLYLGCFIFASTLTMGVFAAVYGEVTHRVADSRRTLYCLSMFSAILCVVVGVLWIVLLSLGLLSAVFP